MSNRYPHLKANGNQSTFPTLENVKVYQYDNAIDYQRFDYDQMHVQICAVPWDMGEAHVGARTISGIGNVVDFGNKTNRNAWFDAIPDSECYRFNTHYRALHRDNYIDVPLPFDVAAKYNYVRVSYEPIANPDSLLEYENKDDATRVWHWFIREVEFLANNTTRLHVLEDAWQNWVYDIDITNMILERGHAPLFATNADKYLKNPIENNDYLLTEDVNYSDTDKVAHSQYIPIGNTKKYTVFAVPISLANIGSITGGTNLSGSTDPSYSNSDDRYGFQYTVSGYEWNYGGKNYANANMPISSMAGEEGLSNGCVCYAIESKNANTFFNMCASSYINLLHAIQAVFIVPDDCIRLGSSFTIGDYTVYHVNKTYSSVNVNLDKQSFGFGSKYSELAKLYTFPYSYLEFTDDEGFSNTVRIENCGNLQVRRELSLAFPFVEYRTFLTGVNGSGSSEYTWVNVNESVTTNSIWHDDFSKFLAKWDIPTYALYATVNADKRAENWADMQARRQRALNAYHDTADSANTERENVSDLAATNIANQNTMNAANTSITAQNTSASSTITARNNSANEAITSANNIKLAQDVGNDNRASALTSFTTNDALAATNAANVGAMSQLAGISATGAGVGALASIASADVGGAISGITSVGTTLASAQVNASCSNAVSIIEMSNNSDVTSIAINTNNAKLENALTANRTVNSENRSAATDNTNTSNNAMTANTATGNAAALETTTRSSNTMDANAGYSRNSSIRAAKRALTLAQTEEQARYRAELLAKPVRETQYSGDASPDAFRRRGVRVNIRTQPKAAIEQTGDEFLRYGYMFGKQWDFKTWVPAGHKFCFWQLKDFWVKGLNVPDMYMDKIRFFLFGGVTVWSAPEYIGNTSIYDN